MNKSIRLFWVALIAISFAACSKPAEYLATIPKDASIVLTIDVKSLYAKSGDSKELINQLIDKQLPNMPKEGQQMMSYLKNPSESGIAIDKPLVYYKTAANDIGALIAAVDDEAKLQKMIETAGQSFSSFKLKSEKGYKYAELDGALLVFNSTSVIITQMTNDIEKLITLEAKDQLIKDDLFADFLKKEKDLNIWCSMDNLISIITEMNPLAAQSMAQTKGLNYGVFIDFQPGKILVTSDYYSDNKETLDLQKENMKMVGSINGTFSKNIPAFSLFNFAMNLKDGEKLYELLAKVPQFGSTLPMMQAQGVDLKKLLTSIKGDILFSVSNINDMQNPDISLFIETKDDFILATTVQMLQKTGIPVSEIGKGTYQFANQYWGSYQGGKTVFCSKKESLDNLAKGFTPSLSAERYASAFKGTKTACTFDVAQFIGTPFITALGSQNPEMNAVLNTAKEVDYIQVTTPNDKSEISFVFKNKKDNSLNVLIKQLATLAND